MDRVDRLRAKFFREHHHGWYSGLRFVFYLLCSFNATFPATARLGHGESGYHSRGIPTDSQWRPNIALFFPVVDYFIYKIPNKHEGVRSCLETVSALLYMFFVYHARTYFGLVSSTTGVPQEEYPFLFFQYVSTILRINQTQNTILEFAMLLTTIAFPYSTIADEAVSHNAVQMYTFVTIIHCSSFLLAYGIFAARRATAYRLWEQCHLHLILQKKIEMKQKYIHDFTDFHGIRRISELLENMKEKERAATSRLSV